MLLKIGIFVTGVSLIFNGAVIPYVAGTQQSITLYNEANCEGEKKAYTNSANITDPWDTTTASFKFMGLWTLTASNETHSLTLTPLGPHANGECIDKEEQFEELEGVDPSTFLFVETKRIGPADMTTKQLLLFPEEDFEGKVQTISKNETDLNISIKSFVHFGDTDWLLYPEKNFTGEVNCLHHEEQNKTGDTYTYENLDEAIQVGSVQMGKCNEGDDDDNGGDGDDGGDGGDNGGDGGNNNTGHYGGKLGSVSFLNIILISFITFSVASLTT